VLVAEYTSSEKYDFQLTTLKTVKVMKRVKVKKSKVKLSL
jgi:hypothetical protein